LAYRVISLCCGIWSPAGYSVQQADRPADLLVLKLIFGPIALLAERGARKFCRSWKNQTEVTVPGSHFIQEDSGPAIGRAVADWMKAHSL
jgi:hypothetical protein